MDLPIVIVGGGVTGLEIARNLSARGKQIVLVEASGKLGGLARGFSFQGVSLEFFYHHLFRQDADLIDLCRLYGLEQDLLWLPSRSAIFAQGRFWPLATPVDFLRCAPIGSLWQRFLMGWNLRRFTKTANWKPYDSMSCEEYFRLYRNEAAYRNLWEPLLKAKYGKAYRRAPASFLWGRIHPRAQSRQKGRETLGYLRGGFQRLINAISNGLQQSRVQIQTGVRVERVTPGEKPLVVTSRGEWKAERVIWTAPPAVLASCLERAGTAPPAELTDIEYDAAVVLILVVRKRLGEFYWINNIDPDVSFGICIEHTNLVPPDHYDGKRILYLGNYVNRGDELLTMDAERLFERHWPSLQKLYPELQRDDIERFFAWRDDHATPVYDLGYRERMPKFTGTVPRVDIVGMAQVYPEDRNMSHCVANARRYCREVWQCP